jgi:excisionase family DNA binding protein
MEMPYMNVSEVAEALGITPGAVRKAVADGKIAAIRKGGGEQRAGFLLIEKTEVERYRAEHLGRRGVGSPSHPLHGVGRRRKGVQAFFSVSDRTSAGTAATDGGGDDPTPRSGDADGKDTE